MEALQLHQIPKEAGAAELGAKAGVDACEKPKGNPSVFVPCAQVQTKLAAHERYWRLPGSRRSLPPRRAASRTFGVTKLLSAWLSCRARESPALPPGAGGAPRGNNARPSQATPSPRRGAATAPPTPHHVKPGQNPSAPPGPGPPVPRGCPGAGRGPGRGPGPRRRPGAAPLTGRQPGQQQRPPAAPARVHGAASSARPRTSRRATPPRPQALPFPWHLSQGRALQSPPSAAPRRPPARRQVRLPSSPAPSAAKPDKIPAASFGNCLNSYKIKHFLFTYKKCADRCM